jgi:hypothetical protein
VLLPAITVGLPLLGGDHAAHALGDARGDARGLHPHRPRAKGLLEQIVVNRHALKNACLPG